MNEMNIGSFLKERISSYTVAPVCYNEGRVIKSGDGVVTVEGLKNIKYGELLSFPGNVFGMALDLAGDETGAVLFDCGDAVSVGATVHGTGRVTQIPVGDALLGRIIDSIGRPLDDKPLSAEKFLPAERPAPGIIDRQPVHKPMHTGILAIDSMIPIGRGQRELIIGDRQTGKTTIAIDSIINQKNSDMLCVYCAVGQKASTIAEVVNKLKIAGAMEYTVIVAATASDSPAMQYLAPYCACTIAEGFMEKGKDVLVIYDDLSKHAVAYRTMSLLLHHPPGREAYPGDVFYLHSRLLERSACLSEEKGGGSITALPIIETMAGNISAFIPTNVISITDGQIFLETELFNSGIRPAINTGLSVSRVGRNAQTEAMKLFSGSLRIEMSQYREMAVFTRFGSEVDKDTKKMLDNGEALSNLLKQNKNEPYSLFRQISLLRGHAMGKFTGIAEKQFPSKIRDYLSQLENMLPDIVKNVNESGSLPETELRRLDDAIAGICL